MPCRDEMSKRINFAFAVTERKENRTLREKSHFAGAKCFALRHLGNAILTAKQTINNRLAGRAAKGASPVASTKKTMENDTFSIVFFIHCESNGISAPLGVYHQP